MVLSVWGQATRFRNSFLYEMYREAIALKYAKQPNPLDLKWRTSTRSNIFLNYQKRCSKFRRKASQINARWFCTTSGPFAETRTTPQMEKQIRNNISPTGGEGPSNHSGIPLSLARRSNRSRTPARTTSLANSLPTWHNARRGTVR